MSTSNPSEKESKINFRNELHETIIREKQLSFYEKRELFDIILNAGTDQEEISAHKIVLSEFSDYFFEKFRTKRKEYHESKEIDTKALKLIINFMYWGEIELNLENSGSILRTAVFLKINILVEGCCNFIKNHIDESNSLKYFSLSNELCLSPLKDKCLEYIYIHFECISKQKELLLLNDSNLKGLLEKTSQHGNRDLEEFKFLAILAWTEHDKVNRKNLTFKLLSMVRHEFLTLDFIFKKWSPVGYTTESSELVYRWLCEIWGAQSNENGVSNNSTSPLDPSSASDEADVSTNSSNSEDVALQTPIWKQLDDKEKNNTEVSAPTDSIEKFNFGSKPNNDLENPSMNPSNSREAAAQITDLEQSDDEKASELNPKEENLQTGDTSGLNCHVSPPTNPHDDTVADPDLCP